MGEAINLRRLALSFLEEYEAGGKYANLAMNSHKTESLTQTDKAFLTKLFYTSVERKITYDYYIGAVSGRGLDKISPRVKNILRLGICQLLDMDSVPAFAAVNETVKLAKHSGERSFINGVLRAVERQSDRLPLPDKDKKYSRYLSVKYSFPHATVKKFISVFGESETERLLSYFSQIPPTDLSVNTLKISREDFCKRLSDAGYKAEISPISPITVRVLGSVSPRLLPGYDEGLFFVEDAACAAAVALLSPKASETLFDVCAAPGGKSFAAAVMMGDAGKIQAYDIHESKLSLIESGAMRLGLSSVFASVRDATAPDESLFGTADAIICDVPCSGLGVLGKKPDIRHKDLDELKELPELQYSILSASARYLKPGGRMIYSTCTLLPEENREVVDRFLSENPGYHTADFEISGELSRDGSFTFLPHIHGTDGFFVTLIEKK